MIDRRAAILAGFAAALAPRLAAAQSLDEAGYALGDQVLGAADAPVTVIEYASLTCPHCARFHNETFPAVKRDYIDAGKVRFVFRDVYFDKYGLWAAMLARCGGPDTFFPFVDTLFERQAEWTRAESIPAELQRIGRIGGLSNARIEACLTDRAFLERLVGDYQTNAGADDVRSTPTFIIDGEKFEGAMSVADFTAILDRKLGV